jgi:glycosyltransferase involved in cell wall biosynthesis
MPSNQETRGVQIIVPARNEQESIGRCLESLASQQGIEFAITVVDDGSTDRTRAIAESFAAVTVISSEEPAAGVTGKCNALISAMAHTGPKDNDGKDSEIKNARSTWLLFTDADTFHYPGSLAAAVAEAEERGVDLLSYSPEQETITWSERALMPVIFAELMRSYPPERINDLADPAVAANGQYILVRRRVYEALGGHAAVAGRVLEDVELARLFKSTGHKIWFRQGPGLVRTRMYRSFSAMMEGWTKNLALLFPRAVRLALFRLVEFGIITGTLVTGPILVAQDQRALGLALLGVGALFYLLFMMRIRKAQLLWKANLVSIFGLPLFVVLLLRSYLHSSVRGAVNWKGRKYIHSAPPATIDSSIRRGNSTLKG